MVNKFIVPSAGVPATLKRLRQDTGLSQQEAAKRIGHVASWLGNYENGRRNVKILTLEKMAAFYGFEVKVVFVRKRGG